MISPRSKAIRVLSIETSCDETAVSVIEAYGGIDSPTYKILGNALYSQIDTHSEYGGVFPTLAKREHAKNAVPLLRTAISNTIESLEGTDFQTGVLEISEEKKKIIKEILSKEEGLYDLFIEYIESAEIPEIDCVAVTEGPGLEPALWVGVSFAKALALALEKPLVPVNHMEGHIVSVLMSDGISCTPTFANNSSDHYEIKSTVAPQVHFPALALLISGGHTELVLSENWHQYKILGQTVDDAVGEAFDKVARLLNLPYPGGPKISKLAAESRAQGLRESIKKETGEYPWTLPRPMINSKNLDFSFSGLKTAVLYAVQKKMTGSNLPTNFSISENTGSKKDELSDIEKMTLAEEFENAVTEVILSKTKDALENHNCKTLIVGGGVIANTYIRNALSNLITQKFPHTKLLIPSIDLTTDNSVMIGIAGYLRFAAQDPKILLPEQVVTLTAKGNLSL